MPASQFRVVFMTVPDPKLADELAKALVEAKLAACVSAAPPLRSHYFWEGKLQSEEETLLIVKTRAGLVGDLVQFVRERHPAEVPEIISLPVMEGDRAYLDWLGANTRLTKPEGGQPLPL